MTAVEAHHWIWQRRLRFTALISSKSKSPSLERYQGSISSYSWTARLLGLNHQRKVPKIPMPCHRALMTSSACHRSRIDQTASGGIVTLVIVTLSRYCNMNCWSSRRFADQLTQSLVQPCWFNSYCQFRYCTCCWKARTQDASIWSYDHDLRSVVAYRNKCRSWPLMPIILQQ